MKWKNYFIFQNSQFWFFGSLSAGSRSRLKPPSGQLHSKYIDQTSNLCITHNSSSKTVYFYVSGYSVYMRNKSINQRSAMTLQIHTYFLNKTLIFWGCTGSYFETRCIISDIWCYSVGNWSHVMLPYALASIAIFVTPKICKIWHLQY